METIKSAHHSIGDTISELAAALTRTGNCHDLPGKLVAFSKESANLSCDVVVLKVVADLVETARNSSSIFKTYLANFVQALFAITRASEDKDSVRQMAVEVLLCIVEDEDLRLWLSIPEFASEFVPILLELMLKFEGDKIDQNKATLDEDTTDFIGEALIRVASGIGKGNVKNIIFAHILKYLKRDEWQYKLVAIREITKTASFLPRKGIVTLLDEIVELLKIQLNNQHPRVRFATCEAIGVIAARNYPLFQKSYAKAILPLFVARFDDPCFEVQGNAAGAFKLLAEETEMEEVMLFADQFMDKFLERIKPENPTAMREHCITVISALACVIEKKFMKYHSIVVPVLKGVIVTSSTKKEWAILEKALDCITTISGSVGDEMIQADAHEVMHALLNIDGAVLKSDDPLKENIQESLCRMCRTLKEEFAPYLPQLIPNVLKVSNIEPQPQNDKKVDGEVMTIVADGKCTEKKYSEKNQIMGVINLLSTFIEVLGEQFGEYLVAATQSLLPLLSFNDDDINRSALTAIAEVFTAARESSNPATHKKLSLWVDAIVEKVFKNLIPGDNDAGITDVELILIRAKTNGLSKCLRNAGPDVLNAQQVGAICEKVFRLLKKSTQRSAITETCKYKREQLLRVELFELIGFVMSFHADLYLQTGAELCSKFIETHLDPNCSPSDRALALYVFDNVLEHLKDKSAPLWPTFASCLVENMGDPDPVVVQAAAYGLIQAAKCPKFPAELIQKAAAQLFALINVKQSQKQADSSATDRMIAALGTIVVHRLSCLQPSPEQFVNLWINNLPLEFDFEEAVRTHSDLVDLLAQKNLEVLGPQNANLSKLTEICASIYQTPYTTAKIDEGIRDFMQAIGFDVISSVGANFDEGIQQSIKRIHHDSQA